MYPIDMRHFTGKNKISKFDVLEVECKKDKDKLGRKESYKVRPNTIKLLNKDLSKPKPKWKKRNQVILPSLSNSIQELKDLYEKDKTSLGIIKPTELIDFIKTDKLELFEKEGWSFTKTLDGRRIPNVTKIPHIFKYKFKCKCCQDKIHEMQCEDWELFESYRSWGKRYKDPVILWDKLYYRFYEWMKEKRHLYLIMGMYSQYPTWFVIGLYYPPKNLI